MISRARGLPYARRGLSQNRNPSKNPVDRTSKGQWFGVGSVLPLLPPRFAAAPTETLAPPFLPNSARVLSAFKRGGCRHHGHMRHQSSGGKMTGRSALHAPPRRRSPRHSRGTVRFARSPRALLACSAPCLGSPVRRFCTVGSAREADGLQHSLGAAGRARVPRETDPRPAHPAPAQAQQGMGGELTQLPPTLFPKDRWQLDFQEGVNRETGETEVTAKVRRQARVPPRSAHAAPAPSRWRDSQHVHRIPQPQRPPASPRSTALLTVLLHLQLGEGMSGLVYRVKDIASDRVGAVKVRPRARGGLQTCA